MFNDECLILNDKYGNEFKVDNSKLNNSTFNIQHSKLDKLPLISIITVVFNGEKYLEETILSVINQTYPNVEYIIIDGGSTDGTLDIIKKYEHAIDYWVSEPDKGIYDAMNKGIKVAKGNWIYFLGADDILYDVLHKVADNLDVSKKAIYGDVYMPKKHKIYNGKFTKFKMMFHNICHQAIVYNKEVFKKNQFDLKYKLLADYAFNLSHYDEKSFHYIPILIAFYNDLDGSSSNGKDEVFQKEKPDMIKKFFPKHLFIYFYLRKQFVNFLDSVGIKELLKRQIKGTK